MSEDIGIDLGTVNVIAYVKGKGIVLREPSVIAINKKTGETLAIGKEAKKMMGRTPSNISTIMPLKDGVISDFTATLKMLKYYIKKVCGKRLFAPRIMICVPAQVTEVERRAVIDAGVQAGAKKVYLIEEPVAAAMGAGIDISKPSGNLIIDVGGGTTDIAVISICGSVVNTTIKTAGNTFDEAIIKYIKKKYGVLIGEKTAEDLKMEIGCLTPMEEEKKKEISGRDIESGLPRTIEISSNEMIKVLLPQALRIVEAVKSVIEKTPPELVEDISEKGIYMTGGGSLLYGIDTLISNSTGINVMIAQDAISCVALGTGKALDNLDILDAKSRKMK